MVWILILIVAAVLGVLSCIYHFVRIGHDRDTGVGNWYGVGKFLAAIAAALAILVIAWNFVDDVLEGAGWWNAFDVADSKLIRKLFVAAFVVFGSLYVYFAYRDRHPE